MSSPFLLRFPAEQEMHRAEDAEAAGFGKGDAGEVQERGDLRRPARHDAQPLKQPQRTVGQPPAGGRAAEAGEGQAGTD